MAYADVASLSHTIHIILNHHQASVSPQFRYQITSLDEHVVFLQSFLEDFPDESGSWEERMGEEMNVAEDIIELLLLDLTFGSSSKSDQKNDHDLPHDFDRLERVIKEIALIAKEVKERNKAIDGFNDDDLEEIISRLCEESPEQKIIPIVGKGGTGKTTLARNAYNHPLISEHFEIRAWVTVSLDYSTRGIIRGLLGSMHAESTSNLENKLLERLVEILWQTRYLIVLDDVRSEETWDELKLAFPFNSNGSRILVTTRLSHVASCVSSDGYIHEMHVMNLERSWILLQQRVFNGNCCPPKLQHLGKMIAKSCKGIPLAIEVVSGTLRANLTPAAWEEVAEGIKTATEYCEDAEHLLEILRLSYFYMPHNLRPCLLYLGIFPDDYEIRASRIINLWVAEGFLNESESDKTFEETAEEHLEDLVTRNLVRVAKRKSDGRIKSFSIHHLTREMCIKQACVDSFFLLIGRHGMPAQALELQRRVSTSYHNYHILENSYGSTVRSIIFSGAEGGIQCSSVYLRLLRVLDLLNASTNFFEKYKLSEVFEPFHLRYLAFVSLSYKIPVAISGLHNLQTLIIHASFPCEFVHLPVEIWNLRQLRHLIVHNCHLPKQEGELYALENLQTLTKAVDFICSEEKLRMILNLKKLGILVRKHREDYQLHNLVHLQKLEILTIETDSSITRWHMVSLAFPPTLRKLSLSGVGLPWEDMEIVGSLPNLQVLKLRNHGCSGRAWATKEGGFSQLKFLLLDRTDLEFWITQSSHFPKLECLVLHHCGRLRKIPSEMGEILTLKSIEVDDLNRSLLDSAKQMQARAQVQVQVHAVEKRMAIVTRLMALRSLALDSIAMCSIM